MKVGFVVLGYGNYPMYAECVDWLLKIKGIEEASIILVDNCSPDGTGERIREKTKGIDFVTVLQNEKNEGFAKGNNLGYRYARNTLGCNIIVVMNSDVFIKDNEFLHVLQNVVTRHEDIAVIAPDVLGASNRHTNPYRITPVSIKEAKRRLVIKRFLSLIIKLGIDYKSSGPKIGDSIEGTQTRVDHVVPHGACIIYCNEWTIDEDKAYYPGTFLYHEEFFLDEYMRARGYLCCYIPELVVKHIGDASLDNAIKQNKDKKLFVLKNQIDSLKQYLAFVKNPIEMWEGKIIS
jgi:GT2 family glycosyltransferase